MKIVVSGCSHIRFVIESWSHDKEIRPPVDGFVRALFILCSGRAGINFRDFTFKRHLQSCCDVFHVLFGDEFFDVFFVLAFLLFFFVFCFVLNVFNGLFDFSNGL